ncbi:MAG: dienelactone hydrolase family protein [Hyphomonadaceae bacterium]|nr:dienelactone hydrolase family protein [Hyphomonadaceae bacterium]
MATGSAVLIGPKALEGELSIPERASGLVIFAHGSGSSRFSPRNVQVAEALQRRGLATLLFDLLTQAESADRRNVFDIPLLAARVGDAIRWARADARTVALPIGLFGASTGAGAALVAAAAAPVDVRAVVSRGGRPDLAADALGQVRAATLLIIGGADVEVLALNRTAAARMTCDVKIEIVPGAGHLFEERGAMDRVIALAGDWFIVHLRQGASL